MTTTPVRPSLARDEALAFAERAECAQLLINDEHARALPDKRVIGRAHNELGLCLKLAEVHAILAVADEVRALRFALADEDGQTMVGALSVHEGGPDLVHPDGTLCWTVRVESEHCQQDHNHRFL